MDKNCSDLSCRRNRVGGQAIIEGVMMKHDENVAIAVRKEDGSIEIINQKFGISMFPTTYKIENSNKLSKLSTESAFATVPHSQYLMNL